jgi:hypothetical protein
VSAPDLGAISPRQPAPAPDRRRYHPGGSEGPCPSWMRCPPGCTGDTRAVARRRASSSILFISASRASLGAAVESISDASPISRRTLTSFFGAPATQLDTARHGIDLTEPSRYPKCMGHTPSVSPTPGGTWVSVALDSRWTAAFRLVPQKTAVVVAELRVFPADINSADRNQLSQLERSGPVPGSKAPGSPEEFSELQRLSKIDQLRSDQRQWKGGRWSERLGDVPYGGLPARLVREKVRFGQAFDELEKMQGRLARSGDRQAVDFFRAFQGSGWESTWPRALAQPHARSREERLAFVADTYCKALGAGAGARRRINIAVAEVLGLTPRQARDRIRDARDAGLLTPAPGKGSPGGALTPRARVVLRRIRARSARVSEQQTKETGLRALTPKAAKILGRE